VPRSFIEPIPEQTFQRRDVLHVARNPRNRYLRMTTIRTREYMREYRFRKDGTYKYMLMNLAAEILR
jgi:hypothetical protein